MKGQLDLTSSKYLVLSEDYVQDIEIAEMIAPRKYGSRVHVRTDPRLRNFIGKEVLGAIDFNQDIGVFLFEE